MGRWNTYTRGAEAWGGRYSGYGLRSWPVADKRMEHDMTLLPYLLTQSLALALAGGLVPDSGRMQDTFWPHGHCWILAVMQALLIITMAMCCCSISSCGVLTVRVLQGTWSRHVFTMPSPTMLPPSPISEGAACPIRICYPLGSCMPHAGMPSVGGHLCCPCAPVEILLAQHIPLLPSPCLLLSLPACPRARCMKA